MAINPRQWMTDYLTLKRKFWTSKKQTHTKS